MVRLGLLSSPTPRLPHSGAARRAAALAAAAVPHMLAAVLVLAMAAAASKRTQATDTTMHRAMAVPFDTTALVFLAPPPGAGRGGGGGGGNGEHGPIRRASGIGIDEATLRTRRHPMPPATTAPAPRVVDEETLPALVLDARPLASGWFNQTGLPSGGVLDSTSTGEGSGGGVGTGIGTGIGPGRGPGFGPGEGGGIGGGVYQPGGAVSAPRLIAEVLPDYPASALERNVRGRVRLSIIVRHDGHASDIRVVRPLDPDLDEAAIRAVAQWRFEPGRLGAVAVDVMALVDVDFSIR